VGGEEGGLGGEWAHVGVGKVRGRERGDGGEGAGGGERGWGQIVGG